MRYPIGDALNPSGSRFFLTTVQIRVNLALWMSEFIDRTVWLRTPRETSMKRGWILVLLLVFACGLLFPAEEGHSAVLGGVEVPGFVGYVPNEIVVKIDESILSRMKGAKLQQGRTGVIGLDELGKRFDVSSIVQQFPGAKKRKYRGRAIHLAGWHKMRFSEKFDVKSVIKAYKAIPGVIDAQPIGIHAVLESLPNDTDFADQWHLHQNSDVDMDAPEAWDIETGNSDITVAILDSGVRYYHKDLGGTDAAPSDPSSVSGNMWMNPGEVAGNGIDDDGNGFVDDWIGWDFVDGVSDCWAGEDCATQDNDPRDFNGHGTHVAGLVSALNNNGYATASPAGGWGNGTLGRIDDGVNIMPLRIGWSGRYFVFFEVGFVRMDFAAQAFRYAADQGAKLVNSSWGSSNTGGLGDAIDYYLDSGGLIFKAAGNDNSQSADYMSSRNDVISISATDIDDCKADFSNFGSWVDISSSGTDIWSLYHSHDDPENDYTAPLTGTSMASPLALGVAALIWSQNPSLAATEVEQRLYDSADDIDVLSCNASFAGQLGAGRVNAFNAVNAAAPTIRADFRAGSPTSGCTPLTVVFEDLSSGEVETWGWDFGTGETSTDQNPTHQYMNPGTYTVALTVTGPGGSDTETKTGYVVVASPPDASFSGSSTSGDAPLTVGFTDGSTGNPTSWEWDFGDGRTSLNQNPSHEYLAPGTYTVTLTVTNACDSDTQTQVDYITVKEPAQQTMRVESVAVSKENFFGVIFRGNASVRIVDQGGSPVSGATATGSWPGGATDTDQLTTNSNGEGTAVSNWSFGDTEFTFCVNSVTKSGFVWDTVETCGTTP
jgi:PKD repeat protein